MKSEHTHKRTTSVNYAFGTYQDSMSVLPKSTLYICSLRFTGVV
ncbi:MAG: hypothetical protein AVDCRST_MAG93-9731 [uncultured Chloroflexia bacterium]|uniref:Uncharacterized protein n=1 Tax=uncultured Chloroflexia bacterium TaxID=1672391 RepID=A0A6J4NLJ9_9CHLR|nr:MAG: hypothetical protein AVDCRST_MAG93-9731 [uncultured Chloroflexia bacterium]